MFDPLNPMAPPDPDRFSPDGKAPDRGKPAWWLWGTVGVILALVVGASVVMGLRSPGSDRDPAATTAASGPSATGESAGSESGAPAAPGQFGMPSMPSPEPMNPWKGFRPVGGIDVESFKAALTQKWQLDFRTRPVRGGIQHSGLAGDLGRQQRRLDGIVVVASASMVYRVMCQAGGTQTTPTDETSLGFVRDCLGRAVTGENWQKLAPWLDEHLRSMAGTGGESWFDMTDLRMFVKSDGHVISCALVNTDR